MKVQEFVQAMGDVNEKYVEEALHYKKSSSVQLKVWRAVAIAACAVLAASAAFGIMSMNGTGSGMAARSVDSGEYYYSAEVTPETTAAGEYNSTGSDMSRKSVYNDAAVSEDFEYELDDMAVPLAAPAQTNAAKNSAAFFEAGETAAETAAEADMEEAAADTDILEKKIIYNVNMDMQTREFDAAVRNIEALAEQVGGYCEEQYISNASQGYRNASYTLRIPSDRLDEFMEQVGQICTVTYSSKSAQDVSDSYYDIQSRLESARTKLARLRELMNEAENMEDLITIESAISDVEWEIDNLGSSLKYYDSHVSYSTVTINLKEVYEVVMDEAPMTFGERIGSSFNQGMRSIGMFFKNLLIWLAASWLWLIIIAAIAVVVIILIRKAVKKKGRKHSKDGED